MKNDFIKEFSHTNGVPSLETMADWWISKLRGKIEGMRKDDRDISIMQPQGLSWKMIPNEVAKAYNQALDNVLTHLKSDEKEGK
jgi:hypothetical protein